jgi:hypothetical protein
MGKRELGSLKKRLLPEGVVGRPPISTTRHGAAKLRLPPPGPPIGPLHNHFLDFRVKPATYLFSLFPMKFTQFLLVAAAVCATTAASAQTAPVPATAPRGTGTTAPSATPSGTPPAPANPKGAVSAGEVFTTGSPDGDKMKMSKRDQSMKKKPDGGKMKPKM